MEKNIKLVKKKDATFLESLHNYLTVQLSKSAKKQLKLNQNKTEIENNENIGFDQILAHTVPKNLSNNTKLREIDRKPRLQFAASPRMGLPGAWRAIKS